MHTVSLSRTRKAHIRLLGSAAILALTAACDDNSHSSRNPVAPLPEVTYRATIERTQGGIPHITAEDFGSLGFGTGYAAAQDNFCALARNILQYRAQLAQYLGEGEDDDNSIGSNLDSDFFYQMMVQRGYYDHAIDPELDAQFGGFAAGFNRYLKDTGIDNIPDPACRGASWVQQMTQEDVRRFNLKPVFLPNLASLILPARPPGNTVASTIAPGATTPRVALLAQGPDAGTAPVAVPGGPGPVGPAPLWSAEQQRQMTALVDHLVNPFENGSNGVAIGRELSSTGKGILYTNPHLDWAIDFRMYPRHHIIPGVLNELGANTFERPNVGFGTNGDIAWTNTVSTSTGLTFYKLDLVSGDPMSYLFDGEIRKIEPLQVTVRVKGADDSLSDANHTFYFSHFGPMTGGQFPWLPSLAFTLRIAEEGPRGMQGGAIGIARSKNVRELKASLNKSQHTAATNTIAADSSGEVLYGDLGPVVNFTDQQLSDCVFSGPTYQGNTSRCEWNTDADAAAPGLLGPSKQAYLFRTDYVTNSNDTYWLSNPNEPLVGIPLVQGDRVGNERTLRTRSGLAMIHRRIEGSDGLGGNVFGLDSLTQRMLSNENYAGQLLRDDLVKLCEDHAMVALDTGTPDAREVRIGAACPVLAAWDLHSNTGSRGSHLFREFLREAHALDTGNDDDWKRFLPALLNYSVAFDIDDPVNTPRGLDNVDNPVALQALALAVEKLESAGMPLDAKLGDIQTVTRGEVFPWHGGEEFEGVFNKIGMDLDEAAGGYPEPTGSGASWVMTVQFTDDGPVARGILVYSLSTSSESAHYNDMTALFSDKQLVDIPYHPEDVTAAALSTIEVSEGANACLYGGWEAFSGEHFADEASCIAFFSALNDHRVTEYVTR